MRLLKAKSQVSGFVRCKFACTISSFHVYFLMLATLSRFVRLRIAMIAFAIVSFAGCAKPHSTGLVGTWHAAKIKYQQRGSEAEAAPINVAEYGTAVLELREDHTYKLQAEAVKEVIIERKVFGDDVKQTLVPANNSTLRTGSYRLADSVLDLYAADKSIFAHCVVQLWDDEMVLTFEDESHEHWWSSWRRS